ncbi:MAG TPA: peptidoglycan endopeptidase [Mycobacterium sp.]|nr:peptidoglycan endopeptidase [Mycobacterium sp.]
MFALVTFMTLIHQVSGTPYVSGGDSPRGTDCSGLASWVSNIATGRPTFGDRFNTGNEEKALLARGFQYGTQPGALVIGWNGYHTAVTLPDGTPVSSGEGGGVKIGGGGAYQRQFTHHMYLPLSQDATDAVDAAVEGNGPAPADQPPADAPPAPPADAPAPPVDGPPAPADAPPAPADEPVQAT